MQPLMSGIESPGEKAIFSRSRDIFTHIFEITAAVKLRKDIIGDRISEGILTHSIPSPNSYLAGSGRRCSRLKLHRHNKVSVFILTIFHNMAMLRVGIF